MSHRDFLVLSYPYTGEPKLNGKTDKVWMRSYLNKIATVLTNLGKDKVTVWFSLEKSFDDALEQDVRARTDLSHEEKYNAGLQKCLDYIAQQETKLICFVVKAPGDSSVADYITEDLKESKGMRAELVYAKLHGLPKIVLLQQGMERVGRVSDYTDEAEVVLFDFLERLPATLANKTHLLDVLGVS